MNILRIRNELRNGKSIFDIPLRVTFYARVSTDKEEQLNSLENQVQYFTEFIRSRPNWTYVEGYVDEGISGASTKKRDNFLRMIADAKQVCSTSSSPRKYPAFPVPLWTAFDTRKNCWNMM